MGDHRTRSLHDSLRRPSDRVAMNRQQIVLRRLSHARPYQTPSASAVELCPLMSSLLLASTRPFHSSSIRYAPTTVEGKATTKSKSGKSSEMPTSATLTARERLKVARKRAAERIKDERAEQERNFKLGGLSSSSLFGGDLIERKDTGPKEDLSFAERNPEHMAQALNPRPTARSRWQRKMVIRDVRRRGRPNKEMRIARSERNHVSRSHFFKTSMKKLAQEVRQHLMQARNEAIVMKGMGLQSVTENEDATVGQDPSEIRPLPHQTHSKALKKGHTADETDIYVAQAWTNRGPYGSEPDYRAR